MPIPDRKQQIIQAHATFICEVVEAIGPGGGDRLDTLLDSASENGWTVLAQALRLVAGGQRRVPALPDLDEEDRVIIETVLDGLRNPATLPDPNEKADPTLAAPGLAHMIHAAGRGDVQALTLISQMAEQMSRVGGDMTRVAGIIRPMINGERDPDRLCVQMDTRGRQLVLQILNELGRLDLH